MKPLTFILLFTFHMCFSLELYSQCHPSFPACNAASELQSNTCGGTYTPAISFQTTCPYQRDGDYAQFNLTAGKTYFFTTSETMVGSHTCDNIIQAMYLHNPSNNCVEYEWGSVTVCMFYTVPAGASGVYKLRMQQNPCSDNSCSARIGYQEVGAPQYVAPYLFNSNVTICSGQSITLGSNANDDYLGADSYWFTGSCGGTQVGTGPTLTVSPTTTTTYYVRNRNRDCHGLLNTYTSCDQITVNVVSITAHPSNISLCPNTSGTLSSTASSGSYQWQYNNGGTWQNVVNSTPAGFTYTNQMTSNLGIAIASPSAGTYQFRCVVSGSNGCSISSNTATLTVNNPNISGLLAGDYLWRGGTLAGDGITYNWGNAANWLIYNGPGNFSSPTVRPYSTSNVRIKPAGTCITGQPTINGTGTVIFDDPGTTSNMCRNIVIESGATLTFQQTVSSYNRHLHVTGNYSNYGTVVPNDGRIKFYGVAQTVFDNSGNANFYEVEVNPTSTVTLSSTNLNINNSLRLNGVIVAGSNRVWLNTTNIDGVSSGIIDGNYGGHIFGMFRRTIQNNNATYRFPVGVSAVLNSGRRLLEYVNNGVVGPSHLDCFASYPFKDIGNNIDALLNPAIATEWGQFLGYVHPEAIWTLTPEMESTSGSYGLRLYVQNFATIDAGIDNKFAILKRPTGSLTFAQFDAFDNTTTIPNGGLPGRVWNSGNGYAEKLGFTQFSEFVIASAPIPLSVELNNMQLECNAQNIRLHWSTTTEHDNDVYRIERSDNGGGFSLVGVVDAIGNSTVESNYEFHDENPSRGVSYYRLSQRDFDGVETILGTLSTNWPCQDGSGELLLYPNPSNGDVQVVFSHDKRDEFVVETFNAIGQSVLSPITGVTQQTGSTLIRLNTNELPVGVYMVHMKVGEKEFIKKLIRSN